MKYISVTLLLIIFLITSCYDGVGNHDSQIPMPALFGALVGDSAIGRALLNNKYTTIIVPALVNPAGIDIDDEEGKIYWTSNGTGKIQSANMDGSDIKDLTIRAGVAADIVFDPVDRIVYWCDSGSNELYSYPVDGGSNTILLSGLNTPKGLVLDKEARNLYFANNGTGEIICYNIDSTISSTLISGLTSVSGLDYTPESGKIYWAMDMVGGEIGQCNIDGTDRETIISVDNAMGVAVNNKSGILYYTTMTEIRQINLDGSQDGLFILANNITSLEFTHHGLNLTNNLSIPDVPHISF